jgi:Flp pilus assembly protein TadG
MQRKMIQQKIGERGQSFTELAISIVFLLVLLAAAIDLGWAFYTLIALRDAVQEAAVYGSMCSMNNGVVDTDRIVRRLQESASAPIDMNDLYYNFGNPDDTNNQIKVCFINMANPPTPTDCEHGDKTLPSPYDYDNPYSVRVEAQVMHQIRTPYVGTFIGVYSYPLRVDVSDLIMRVNEMNEPDNCQ